MMNGRLVGLIARVDCNGLIGYDNQLVFHNKTDLERFRKLTENSTIIIGRKTYESIPQHIVAVGTKTYACPFINRMTHVLHYPNSLWGKEEKSPLVKHFTSLQDAINEAPTDLVWIAGGNKVYEEALLFGLPDIIDLTITNNIYIPSITDSLKKRREKSVYMPPIPLFYQVTSETINSEDAILAHRKYKIRKEWAFDVPKSKLKC